MFFSIQDLELRKLSFDVDFQPGEIDFDENQFRQVGPLHTDGVAELLSNTLGEIRIRGNLKAEMEVLCDRCLETSRLPLSERFDLFYRPSPKGGIGHDIAIDEGEAEIGFYDGLGLELEDVVREARFVVDPDACALPRRLCRNLSSMRQQS